MLNEGDIAQEGIVAEFTFVAMKPLEVLEKQKQEAAKKIHPILHFNDKEFNRSIKSLESFFNKLEALIKQPIPEDLPETKIYQRKIETVNNMNSLLTRSTIKILLNDEYEPIIKKHTLIAIERLKNDYLIASKEPFIDVPTAIILVDTESTYLPINEILTREDFNNLIREESTDLFPTNEDLRNAYYQLVTTSIVPNIIYDRVETKLRKERAMANVPKDNGIIKKNEAIISAHQRITQEQLEKLASYEDELRKRRIEQYPLQLFILRLGQLLFILLLLALFFIYVYVYDRQIVKSNAQLGLLCFLLVIIVATAKLIKQANLSEYLIPIAVVSILVTILFHDVRLGQIYTIVVALLMGTISGHQFNITFTTIIAGTVATYSVFRIRHRNQFFSAIIYISISYVLSIIVIDISRLATFQETMRHCFWGIVNSFLSSFIAQGALPLLENMFGLTTDVTLLELSDLNRPLLKRLAMEAPGTYHHSIVVGNLAEVAAEAINANSLWARVGAYYHDIGKLDKPEYFIENQTRGKNKHDKLSPNMSTLIIKSHIKEGVELAKKYKLPKPIIDIIREHHGTNLIFYFFKKALEKDTNAYLAEHEFRYDGPKPQTREAAIVMLADAIESASRALKDPTISRLKGLIKTIIINKFNDSELDECNLTLRDLDLIAKSFLPILSGIFHTRIDYPERK